MIKGLAVSVLHNGAGPGCLQVVNERWPDSRPAFRNPADTNGARRRETYEDRTARISILARDASLRPDTLAQTAQSNRINLLRTGRAIRWYNAHASISGFDGTAGALPGLADARDIILLALDRH